MATFAPARAWPPCVTRPVTVAPTPALPAFRAATATAPAPIAAGDATVAAALTCPTPGRYGVQNATHAPGDWLKTPLMVSSALYSLAPNVARPGVPTGMSGGGRQTWMYAGPRAACVPVVATR